MRDNRCDLGTRSVRRIGYGAMRLPSEASAALTLLRRAIELGVDHIDTARYYGAANERIRTVLADTPVRDLLVATKVGWSHDGETLRPAARPEDLRAAVHDNLTSLGVERLDLVNLRRGGAPGIAAVDVPIAEQLGVLAELRDNGLIELIGLSAVTLDELDAACRLTTIACVQNLFSFFVRRDPDIISRCATEGIAFVPFFPFGGGRAEQHDALAAVASRHHTTTTQVALAWLLALGPHVLLIPGTSNAAHLEDNLHATELQLTDEDRAQLTYLNKS
jgi:pyridoxine 4-dehydrogenase